MTAALPNRSRLGWLLPAYILLFFAFLLAPIVIVVVVSFTATSYVVFPIEGLSLRWFRRIWEYPPFLAAFLVTIKVAGLSALLGCALGVPTALALTRSKGILANLIVTFLLSPLSMPLILLGFALLFYLSAAGFGVSLLSLVIGHTVVSVPYLVRTVAGVYRGVSPNLEESALVLGATRWQIFRYVTLPLITPGIFAGALFAILLSVDNLPISYFFGSPTTSTLPVVVLSYLETSFDPSIAAISTLQLLIAIGALFLVERLLGLEGMSPAA